MVLPVPATAAMADRADRHALYQRAVNAPASAIEFIQDVYRQTRGRDPRVLREDFCGTALLAATWALRSPLHRAVGVDLDPEPLAWARRHTLAGSPAQDRVELVRADVLAATPYRADVVCALNFSYYLLTTRRRLVAYFKRARRGLLRGGLFVLDSLGGTDAQRDFREEHDCGDFTYIWAQDGFNPLDHSSRCTIGFAFPDGSRLAPAFVYSWRMWTMPEIRDCLAEAGFSRVRIFWEYVDDDDNPSWVEVQREQNQEIWLAYIVAAP